MKPATNSLLDIFNTDVRYVVPLYQRPYVWEEERHWQPLWEDLELVLEHYLAGNDEPARHFLGAIVLDQEDTPPGQPTRRLVIDGQQRLTTLQLLLAAAARAAEHDGAESQARLLQRLTWNDPDLAVGDDRLKVWPTNVNQAAFRDVMRPDAALTAVVDDPRNTIHEAYAYFAKAIGDWAHADEPTGEQLQQRHAALRVTLSNLLQVVSINLEPGDNAQVIFETLNARGTPLLAMDLVKNALFYRAQRASADVDELNSSVWEPEFNRDYWGERIVQGRLRRPRVELFLMHWLTMRLRRTVAATELFAEFRAHVLDRPENANVEDLIRELSHDASVMRHFDELPAGTPEARFFRRLEILDTSTVIPVALLLYRSDRVPADARRRALLMIESWLIRRALCGYTTRGYNRLVVDLLNRLEANLDRPDHCVAEFLSSTDVSSATWPTDDELMRVLTSRPLYGWVNQRRIAMVLSAIELELRSDHKVEDIDALPTNLTIEHVMPQRWRDHWSLGSTDEEARDQAVQRLGNLTLTSGPLNSALSNGPWTSKRAALAQHSILLLNQQITAREHWDEGAIADRGTELASRICALWPREENAGASDAVVGDAVGSEHPEEGQAPSPESSADEWSRLDRQQLRQMALGLARAALESAGYEVTGPLDERSNLLIAERNGTTLEAHVRTSRNLNYTFLPKASFQPGADRAALLVVLLDGEPPRLYLIPSHAWQTPDAVLVDREYDDLASEPEWGINLSVSGLQQLECFALRSDVTRGW